MYTYHIYLVKYAIATISHLYKMTGHYSRAATICCHVIMITVASIQKSGSFTVQIILFVIIILVSSQIQVYFSKSSSLTIEFHIV